MTTPIKKTSIAQSKTTKQPIKKTSIAQSKTTKQPIQNNDKKNLNVNKNEPSVGELLVNRTAAVVLTPIAAAAGTLTIFAAGVNGLVNPYTTFDHSMHEGIKAAGQGADMLEKMWEGRYF